MQNPDYMMYVNLYNILTMRGQRDAGIFYPLLFPFERPGTIERTEETFKKIKIPFVTGAFEGAYTYKMHWQGAQNFFDGIDQPHKHLFVTPPAHAERPFHEWHDEIIRWYDHWLKGIDNGVDDRPGRQDLDHGREQVAHLRRLAGARDPVDQVLPAQLGEAQHQGPPPGGAHLCQRAAGRVRADAAHPDQHHRAAPLHDRAARRGHPSGGPDYSDVLGLARPGGHQLDRHPQGRRSRRLCAVRAARGAPGPGRPAERELTRGWLKASYRELDSERTTPWKPWHRLSPESIRPVVPGEVNEYQMEILSTANVFERGHRICLEITSLDLAEGVAGETYAEYIPNHVCSSKTVLHKVFHNAEYPSHLLLPVIPQ